MEKGIYPSGIHAAYRCKLPSQLLRSFFASLPWQTSHPPLLLFELSYIFEYSFYVFIFYGGGGGIRTPAGTNVPLQV